MGLLFHKNFVLNQVEVIILTEVFPKKLICSLELVQVIWRKVFFVRTKEIANLTSSKISALLECHTAFLTPSASLLMMIK